MATVDPQREINQLLKEWTANRAQTEPELFEVIYSELRKIARAYMRKERPDHTLQTTALVNEAYVRLFQGQPLHWENLKHVFCMMAQTMRRILVDHARTHNAEKRGGEQRRLSLDEAIAVAEAKSEQVIAVDEALERLGKLHPRQEQVVNLRFFGRLTVEEAAAVLDISPETVKLDWRFAKAWLQHELGTLHRFQYLPPVCFSPGMPVVFFHAENRVPSTA
jgi:RNA polymerase sigma factor (TIGR02999 family)